ncbi:MAG: DUF4129 domain-containing protein, partial [Pseudarthrobacter sp.]|nr:DUF4129 domain-containing protein [Pseudarthrobacter sp.]
LGADYGLPPGASETPRAYAVRFRRTLLGEPGGMDEQAHQAVRMLTTGFERYRYGRPDSGGNPGFRAGADVPDAGTGVAALETALRENAPLIRRLRAAWLPPSVMARLGRLAGLPFRAAGRAIRKTAQAAAHLRTRKVPGGDSLPGRSRAGN